MQSKSYEELIKEKDYEYIARILLNNNKARKDNRVLLIEYYWNVFGLTLDEAFKNDHVPNYQSVERKARKLKQVNKALQYDKSEQVDIYKQIGLEIPALVKLF